MSDLVHLHVHSHYSLMDGLCSPHELMQAAKNLGHTALAITDHGTLSSHRDMQKAGRELGVKPILGLEAYISETDRFDKRDIKNRDDNTQVYNHIILLAKNQTGLRNLQTMSEIAWTEGFYRKPRIDMELLAEYGEGIIVLSGCLNGLISKAIERGDMAKAESIAKWFKDRFGDDFYIEVQPHNPIEINKPLLDIADKLNIKPVTTSDCHFATSSQRALEEVLLILSTKPNVNREFNYDNTKKMTMFERLNSIYPDRPISFQDIDVYLQNRSEAQEWYNNSGISRTDIYDNTLEIADKIEEYEYHENLSLLPVPKKSAIVQLEEMCNAKLSEMGLSQNLQHKVDGRARGYP